MPVNVDEIVQLLRTLAEDEQLSVTVSESLKGGLITGGLATLGGLCGGPFGIAVGGAVGGCIAAATAKSFLPLSQVIASLDHAKKEEISSRVENIMNSVNVTDAAALTALMVANSAVKSQVVAEMVSYVRNEIGMTVTRN